MRRPGMMRRVSRNRTAFVPTATLLLLALAGRAQAPQQPPVAPAEADPIGEVVARVVAAEQKLRSVRVDLETTGELPSGLAVTTRGTLRVLRGEQPATRTTLAFTLGDAVRGEMDSAQTTAGILVYEDDPAFGQVYLRFDPEVVADLEWAGQVLRKSDLPGMADGRARTPLGSGMLEGLRRGFVFATDGRGNRAGDAGTWLVGTRRKGLDAEDPDLPVTDRVELFVRTRDQAVLEVVYHTGDKVSQRIVASKVEVDVELPVSEFQVDGRGQRLRHVRQHQPMWELVEDALRQAEARAEAEAAKIADEALRPPTVRPSKRS